MDSDESYFRVRVNCITHREANKYNVYGVNDEILPSLTMTRIKI